MIFKEDPKMKAFLEEMRQFRKEYQDKTGLSITHYYDLRPDENGAINPYFNEPVPQDVKDKVIEVFKKHLNP